MTINCDRFDIPLMLGCVPLFMGLPPSRLEELASATKPVRLDKGQLLFRKGDIPQGLFVVAFGQVKEAVSSFQGEEKIIEIVGPKNTVGETAILLNCPYPYFVESLLDTLLLQVPKEPILDLVRSDTSFAKRMLGGLSARIHSLVRDIEGYTRQSPEQRIVDYLLQREHGNGDWVQGIEISLPASKLAVASRLGMTPETFSRVLGSFADAGFIQVRGRQIGIVDPAQLMKYSERA